MSERIRRDPAPASKAKVALAVVAGEKPLADMAQRFDVHPDQITTWKAQLVEGAPGVSGSQPKAGLAAPAIDVKTLHTEVVELTSTNEFSLGALGKAASEIPSFSETATSRSYQRSEVSTAGRRECAPPLMRRDPSEKRQRF